jgi:isopentenyl-diphosphate delta-isomerase
MEKVILVNEKDEEIGVEEKVKAHREGRLHRAFSIFIFNKNGELLIQKRAKSKYHSLGDFGLTLAVLIQDRKRI